MAETKVKAPDGSVIKIKHPEGATKKQILRNAEILFAQRQQEKADRDARKAQLVRDNPEEYDPSSPQYRAKYGAASGGFLENLAAGGGKAIFDLGRGVKQLGVEAANIIPGVNLDDTANKIRSEQTDTRALDADLMRSGGGLTGNIGANVLMALAPGGLATQFGRGGSVANTAKAFTNPQTLRAAMGSGAVQGALQPLADDEYRAVNAGLGAAGGGLGRALTRPFASSLGRGDEAAIDTLQRYGVPLDVAERTQSSAAQRVSAMLDDSIVTAGQREAFKDTQKKAFTRAVLSTIGEDADEATTPVMQSAKIRIGGLFDDFSKSVNPKADSPFFSSMQSIYEDAQNTLNTLEFPVFERNWKNVMSAIDNGVIPGAKFKGLRSTLSKLSTDSKVGPLAFDMENALLDSLTRSAPASARSTLNQAKGQWRNLKIIQGAIGKGEDRFVSPLRLSNSLGNKMNQNASVFGLASDETLELVNLAKAGRQILGDFPQSGTPIRQQIPTIGAMGAAYAGGGIPGVLVAGGLAKGGAAAMQSQGRVGNLLSQGLPGYAGAPLIQSLINSGIIQQRGLLSE